MFIRVKRVFLFLVITVPGASPNTALWRWAARSRRCTRRRERITFAWGNYNVWPASLVPIWDWWRVTTVSGEEVLNLRTRPMLSKHEGWYIEKLLPYELWYAYFYSKRAFRSSNGIRLRKTPYFESRANDSLPRTLRLEVVRRKGSPSTLVNLYRPRKFEEKNIEGSLLALNWGKLWHKKAFKNYRVAWAIHLPTPVPYTQCQRRGNNWGGGFSPSPLVCPKWTKLVLGGSEMMFEIGNEGFPILGCQPDAGRH